MREILFKAKRIDDGEWVEGYVFDDGFADSKRLFVGGLVIMDYKGTADDRWNVGTAFYEVIPDTICQYTGLTDKNGRKIWENDIVEFEDTGEEGYEYKEGFDFINRARVEFEEARWSLTDFISMNSSVVDEMYYHVEFMDFWQNCEVVGNIFDNADLLGE